MNLDTAKIKCKNFLAFLMKLSAKQNQTAARNVKTLIQGLIDGKVSAEDFSDKLQKEVNSSPKPGLVGFLKESLPLLRQSLASKELTIEGITPPPVCIPTMTPDMAKTKCKNFLTFLMQLSVKQNQTAARNVKTLIQGLIDGKVSAEDFSGQLQKEVDSNPQPGLVGFLKKSLPLLRQSLASKELTIKGITPPPVPTVNSPKSASGIGKGAATASGSSVSNLPSTPTKSGPSGAKGGKEKSDKNGFSASSTSHGLTTNMEMDLTDTTPANANFLDTALNDLVVDMAMNSGTAAELQQDVCTSCGTSVQEIVDLSKKLTDGMIYYLNFKDDKEDTADNIQVLKNQLQLKDQQHDIEVQKLQGNYEQQLKNQLELKDQQLKDLKNELVQIQIVQRKSEVEAAQVPIPSFNNNNLEVIQQKEKISRLDMQVLQQQIKLDWTANIRTNAETEANAKTIEIVQIDNFNLDELKHEYLELKDQFLRISIEKKLVNCQFEKLSKEFNQFKEKVGKKGKLAKENKQFEEQIQHLKIQKGQTEERISKFESIIQKQQKEIQDQQIKYKELEGELRNLGSGPGGSSDEAAKKKNEELIKDLQNQIAQLETTKNLLALKVKNYDNQRSETSEVLKKKDEDTDLYAELIKTRDEEIESLKICLADTGLGLDEKFQKNVKALNSTQDKLRKSEISCTILEKKIKDQKIHIHKLEKYLKNGPAHSKIQHSSPSSSSQSPNRRHSTPSSQHYYGNHGSRKPITILPLISADRSTNTNGISSRKRRQVQSSSNNKGSPRLGQYSPIKRKPGRPISKPDAKKRKQRSAPSAQKITPTPIELGPFSDVSSDDDMDFDFDQPVSGENRENGDGDLGIQSPKSPSTSTVKEIAAKADSEPPPPALSISTAKTKHEAISISCANGARVVQYSPVATKACDAENIEAVPDSDSSLLKLSENQKEQEVEAELSDVSEGEIVEPLPRAEICGADTANPAGQKEVVELVITDPLSTKVPAQEKVNEVEVVEYECIQIDSDSD